MTFDNDPSAGHRRQRRPRAPPSGSRRHGESVSRPVVVREERRQHAHSSTRYGARRSVCPPAAPPAPRRSRSVLATAAAPPWEGRMVMFPPPNGDTLDIASDERRDPEGPPRHPPVRRDADRRHARGRARLLLVQPARPERHDARPVRRRRLPRPVHHPPHRRRARTSTSARAAKATGGQCPFNKAAHDRRRAVERSSRSTSA